MQSNRPVYTTVSGHRHLDREHQSAVAAMAARMEQSLAARAEAQANVDAWMAEQDRIDAGI